MKIERVNAEIQRELAVLIRGEINDPRLDGAMISVMRVETTQDLKYAKVFVSILGGGEAKEIMSVLKNCAGFLKKQLFHRLKVRAVPELLFHLDNSVEYGIKINSILKTLNITEATAEEEE